MKIRIIHWQDTLLIRQKVLWPEESEDFCRVEGDELAKHYGIYDGDSHIGVASTYTDDCSVRLRKFAVLKSYQGRGYGSELLKRIIELERGGDGKIFWCDARQSAVSFYRQFGLNTEGQVFHKFGVPYFKMSLRLGKACKAFF